MHGLHIDCSKMASKLLDLPTEIHLQIFGFIKPYELLHSVSLVNQHFRSCVQDVFRNNILPSLQFELSVLPTTAWIYPEHDMSMAVVDVGGKFQSTDDEDWAYYQLEKIRAEDDYHPASADWRAAAWGSKMTMEAWLPSNHEITISDKNWKYFAANQDRLGDTLALRWKPFIAMYLQKAKSLEEITSALTVRGSQAEAIYSSMFSY